MNITMTMNRNETESIIKIIKSIDADIMEGFKLPAHDEDPRIDTFYNKKIKIESTTSCDGYNFTICIESGFFSKVAMILGAFIGSVVNNVKQFFYSLTSLFEDAGETVHMVNGKIKGTNNE